MCGGSMSPTVGMRFGSLDTDEIQRAVTNPWGGSQLRRKIAHCNGGPLQHHGLEAVVVIQVHMHRGDGQIVMGMLRRGDPLGECALVMVINIGKAGDAMTL